MIQKEYALALILLSITAPFGLLDWLFTPQEKCYEWGEPGAYAIYHVSGLYAFVGSFDGELHISWDNTGKPVATLYAPVTTTGLNVTSGGVSPNFTGVEKIVWKNNIIQAEVYKSANTTEYRYNNVTILITVEDELGYVTAWLKESNICGLG